MATVGDKTAEQLFLTDRVGGLNAFHAWQFPGGKGAGVKIISIDSSYITSFAHEDMPAIPVVVNSGQTDSGSGHGNETLSIISALHNSYGYNGIAPDATVQFARANYSVTAPASNASVIQAAVALLAPGDILLIERQAAGPNYNPSGTVGSLGSQNGLIPIEWWPENLEQIRLATQKGVIVVSVAGNGAENLGLGVYSTGPAGAPPWYRNPFDRNQFDSGSIFVGAASPGQPRTTNRGPIGSRADYSNYGSVVDASFWGWETNCLGVDTIVGGETVYGHYYFQSTMGTSYTAPVVVGALACVQGALKAAGRPVMLPSQARAALRATGFAQTDAPGMPATQRVGPMVNLKALFDYFGLTSTIPAPKITSFTLSTPSIGQGGSATLSWAATDATTYAINGAAVTGNSLVVNPTTTTVYTLTATGGGGSDTAQVALVVTPRPAVITSFTASQTTINQGFQVTLTWATQDATFVRLDGVGRTPSGTLVVSPEQTKAYTLEATGPYGTDTQQLAIGVTPAYLTGAGGAGRIRAADLIANIRRETATELPDAELLAMLNDEQREIAADLKLPTRTVEVGSITTDFQLPTEAQYNALISAEATGEWGTYPLAVWTVGEASERFPLWGSSDYANAPLGGIIYDPTNISTVLRPVPNPCSASAVRITYAIKPPDMTSLESIPFLGEIPEQHHALAYGVIGRLMFRNSDQRYSGYFAQRDDLVNQAWRDSRPAPVRVRRSASPRFRRYGR